MVPGVREGGSVINTLINGWLLVVGQSMFTKNEEIMIFRCPHSECQLLLFLAQNSPQLIASM